MTISGESGFSLMITQDVVDAWASPWKWYELALAAFSFVGLAFLIFLLTRDPAPLHVASGLA